MATYYIKPNGVAQGDLVNAIKDILTATSGSYGTDYITTSTTVLGTSATASTNLSTTYRWYQANSTVSANVSAGSAFASAISARVSAGLTEIYISSSTMSYALSASSSAAAFAASSAVSSHKASSAH